MFKRFGGWFKGKKEIKGPPGELIPENDFQIQLLLMARVPITPLDTFSERAIVEIEKSALRLVEHVKSCMYIPQADGTLRVFPPKKGDRPQ